MTELMPPANWYADPEGSGRWRYWDGAAWTGVYLNQDEPGPSVWKQYWDRAKPVLFAGGVIGMAVCLALGSGAFIFFLVLAWWGFPEEDSPHKLRYAVPYFGAIVVGVGIHAGIGYGLGIAACGTVAYLAGAWRDRLPQQLIWTLMAFSLAGAGVLFFASSDLWR
ncbi:DUF2510 domain-containing protein [Nocardioides marmorisolisilvae]|nr:DUF2510 domain-containing protein [Nocardioides marmorisolisilvae]